MDKGILLFSLIDLNLEIACSTIKLILYFDD